MLVSSHLTPASAAVVFAQLVFSLPGPGQATAGSSTLHGRQASSPYRNANTEKFVIDSANFPHIPFDFGESYAGLLPISPDPNDTQQLFFWFSPSVNPNASEEITVWLNGGPGCSSFMGMFSENGNFQWFDGMIKPVKNEWAWSKLTNMVWIEQPVGVGFSSLGTPTIVGEYDLAQQFAGFWKNFIDAFNMTNRRVYLTGESYAGAYIPYIANEMINQNDTTYYDIRGTMIIDPAINYDVALVEMPMLDYIEHWQLLLQLNDTYLDFIRKEHALQNYTAFYAEHFTFPPKGVFPTPPNVGDGSSRLRGLAAEAAYRKNPCFDVYHITQTCPYGYSPLNEFVPPDDPNADPTPFFNRSEVKAAMHAPPDVSWSECSPNFVFAGAGRDTSPPSGTTVLPTVFDKLPLNLVVHGQLDMLIPSNGTLFSLQNITWLDKQGFSEFPANKLVVPGFDLGGYVNAGATGESGTWVYERNVAFVEVAGAGHAVPQYNPSASFRLLEVLLGRMGVEEGLGGGVPWSVPIGPVPAT